MFDILIKIFTKHYVLRELPAVLPADQNLFKSPLAPAGLLSFYLQPRNPKLSVLRNLSSQSAKKNNFNMSSRALISLTAPPAIPQHILPLIPEEKQQEIAELDKKAEDQQSNVISFPLLSFDPSVSGYLCEKFKECEYNLAASFAKLTALQLAVMQGTISQEEYDQAAKPFFEYLKERVNEKRFLTKHRRFLEADMSEELDKLMRRVILISFYFFQSAYIKVIVPRVVDSSAKQIKAKFDSKLFRKGVLEAYNAFERGTAYCHITHLWFDKKLVKVARLVPKSFTVPEIGYLFGVEEIPKDFFYDWRLGIVPCETVYSN